MPVLKVEKKPGNDVHLVIRVGSAELFRFGLDEPLIVGFDILRKAADYEPPPAWRVMEQTEIRILDVK